MSSAMYTQADIEGKVKQLGPWFHNMDLGGIRTAPDHFLGDYPAIKWNSFKHAIPANLGGKTVLDIGCNGGFYSIEMARRGAARVVSVDIDEDYLRQARFAAEVNGVELEFHRMSVYGVGELKEQFDVVLFLGVLYHLRYPLLALDLLHRHAVKDTLVIQSLQRGAESAAEFDGNYPFAEREIFNSPGFPKLHFVEQCYSNDPTNWWIPNASCMEAMLRSAGFEITAHPEQEVYVCRRGEKGAADEELLGYLPR